MNVIPFADWTPAQHAAAFTVMKAHSDAMVGVVPSCRPDSTEVCFSRLFAGELQACLIAGYVLLYDVGPAWSTKENLLYELLLVKAQPTGNFDEYVQGLRYLAALHNCIAVETGNGVLRPGLRRLYERAGFIKTNETYTLEV